MPQRSMLAPGNLIYPVDLPEGYTIVEEVPRSEMDYSVGRYVLDGGTRPDGSQGAFEVLEIEIPEEEGDDWEIAFVHLKYLGLFRLGDDGQAVQVPYTPWS